MLVNNFLENSAEKTPDKVALIVKGERYTYREVDEMSGRFAGALKAEGLKRGDRVAIYLDNSLEAVTSIFGVLKAGGVFLMINPTTKTEKLRYLLANSGASAMVAPSRKSAVCLEACAGVAPLKALYLAGDAPGAAPRPGPRFFHLDEILNGPASSPVVCGAAQEDTANIIYTSGSTGDAKGVVMAHENICAAAGSIIEYLENRDDDIILNVLPMSFDYGLYQVLMAFRFGGTVILENSFLYPFKVVETMQREKVTGFPIVPTISAILTQMEKIKRLRFDRLRYITNTAAALPVSHITKMVEMFPGVKIYSMYGVTECKRVSYLHPDQIGRRPLSVGKAMPNTEAYVVDEHGERLGPGLVGELVVTGPSVMRGYWEMPEKTADKIGTDKNTGRRVLYTGDLFKTDEDGYLYFVARKDDIIKSRGEKVSPKEVENALYSHEAVAEAAVIGVADPVLGESVKAFVVMKEGAGLTEKEIMRHCSMHLEDFMVPKTVEFIAELPKTGNGKIDKLSLMARTGEKRAG